MGDDDEKARLSVVVEEPPGADRSSGLVADRSSVSAGVKETRITGGSDGSAGAPVDDSPLAHLRHALKQQLSRVLDVFLDWDDDNSGSLSKREFRKALGALGLGRDHREEVNALFDSFDDDHSGSISYNELVRRLREHTPEPSGNTHEVVLDSKNKSALRKAGGGEKGAALAPSVKLDPTLDKPIQTQILEVLQAHRVRVIDLFKDWDDDSKGTVDKKVSERARALLSCVLSGWRLPVDALGQ